MKRRHKWANTATGGRCEACPLTFTLGSTARRVVTVYHFPDGTHQTGGKTPPCQPRSENP